MTTTPATTDVATQLDDIRSLLATRAPQPATERRLDRWLVVAGSVMLPLGLVAIGIGWFGASRTPYLFEQVPYLISGGLLGVGFVIGGALLFFGSWATAAGERVASREGELTAAIDRLRRDLDARLPAEGNAAFATAVDTTRWVATPHGSLRHLPDCAVVASRSSTDLVEVPADSELRICKLCDPTD